MAIHGILVAAFCIVSLANLSAVAAGNKTAEYLTKPFLMPFLLLIYLSFSAQTNWLLVLALVCGFMGDVFLMGGDFFLSAGLEAFLVGHLFYIIAFLETVSIRKINPVVLLAVLIYAAYGVWFYKKISGNLGKMKIPAMIYLICILLMSFSSLLRSAEFSEFAFWFPFTGSLFFILSDSLLSLEIFRSHKKGRGIAVMATYIMAQSLIVAGFLL